MKQEFAIAAEMNTKGRFMVLVASTIVAAGARIESIEDKPQQAYLAEAQTALTKIVGKQNSSNILKAARKALTYLNAGRWDAIAHHSDPANAGLAFAEHLKECHGVDNRTRLIRFMDQGTAEKPEPTAEDAAKAAMEKALKEDEAKAEAKAEAAAIVENMDVFAMIQNGAAPVKTFDQPKAEAEAEAEAEAGPSDADLDAAMQKLVDVFGFAAVEASLGRVAEADAMAAVA